MSFKKVEYFQCTNCEKHYDKEPSQCSCQKRLDVGDTAGNFTIIRKFPRSLEVQCLLCGLLHELKTSNIRVNKSCGCLPRHITLENFDTTTLTADYECKRCGQHSRECAPIQWCCINDD